MKKKVLYILMFLLLTLPITASAYTKVTCGNVTGIPSKIPELTRLFVTIVQIAVPVLLVIFGMLDLLKGITSQKEDEIKKGQQLLIKRIITGLIVFFTFVIVKVIISVVAESSSKNIVDCMDCFLNNEASCIKEKTTKPVNPAEPVNPINPGPGPIINVEK